VVFAIGMFEHINNLDAVLEKIASMLRPGGRAFVHLIVSRVVIPQFLDAGKTLIGEYFPGGKIWPFETIACQNRHLELVDKWFINGMNYWRTLDTWHERFWNSLPALYGNVLDADGVQHWNRYFSLSKACFAPFDGALYGNGQYLFRKPG
jgi:cyclopropane-fatty-acyl-phospholipid synthase